jgi:hypothetical protein
MWATCKPRWVGFLDVRLHFQCCLFRCRFGGSLFEFRSDGLIQHVNRSRFTSIEKWTFQPRTDACRGDASRCRATGGEVRRGALSIGRNPFPGWAAVRIRPHHSCRANDPEQGLKAGSRIPWPAVGRSLRRYVELLETWVGYGPWCKTVRQDKPRVRRSSQVHDHCSNRSPGGGVHHAVPIRGRLQEL